MLIADARCASLMQPVAEEKPFSIGGVFGWMTAGRNRRGVILCGTYGYEQHCAHRSWRELARRIAATGCTTVRFDYLGSGDSADVDPVSLRSWLDAISSVVHFMRNVGNVEETVLVGLRLGGTLAALTTERLAIDQLILLAPFLTGEAYLREMSLQARMINILPDGSPMPGQAGELTVGGFALNATLLSEIRTINLTEHNHLPAADIVLMGEERGRLSLHYRRLGAKVTIAPFPDLARLCANAIDSEFTEATLANIASHVAGGGLKTLTTQPFHLSTQGQCICGVYWTEEPVQLQTGVFGIRCRPRLKQSRATVLFLNMGLDVHSGLGRQTTDIARRLAEVGIETLRIDLRGAGDSPDRPDCSLPLYDVAALDDVRTALDSLTGHDAGPLIIAGTCNGAYLAFHAVCQDHRIGGAVLVNLYCFDWALAHNGAPYSSNAARNLGAYLSIAKQGGAWMRLLQGRTSVLKIFGAISRRLCNTARLKMTAISRHGSKARPIAERIAHIRRRGAQLALLYSENDLGLADLHTQLGHLPSKWEATCGRPVRIVRGADHAFGANHARDEFFAALLEVSEVVS